MKLMNQNSALVCLRVGRCKELHPFSCHYHDNHPRNSGLADNLSLYYFPPEASMFFKDKKQVTNLVQVFQFLNKYSSYF